MYINGNRFGCIGPYQFTEIHQSQKNGQTVLPPPPTVKDTVMVFLVFFPAYYMLAMTSLALDANGAKTNDTKNGDTLIRMSTSCKTSTIGSENRTTKKNY